MNESTVLPEESGHKRSRAAYCLECMFEYFVSLLMADAFLAKVLTSLGFSDSATGVISSLISLAFLFQLFSVFVVRKIRNVKRFCVTVHSLGQLFFLALYLLPLLPSLAAYRKPLAVACILIAYLGNYLVSSMIYRWGNSYVSPDKRGSYTAMKECVSLFGGVVVSLVVGFVIERFEKNGDLNGGFLFSAICIFIFCLCDFICLMLIKNSVNGSHKEEGVKLSRVLSGTLGNKSFRHVLVLDSLWRAGIYFTIGFLGTYKLSDLGFTVSQVQIMTVSGCVGRMLFSPLFGRLSDKRSFVRSFEVGISVAAVSFLCSALATPGMRVFIIIETVLYNIAHAGISGGVSNMLYNYVDGEIFAEAVALRNGVSGICGFLAALFGGKLLAVVQSSGNTFLGFSIRGQQVLSVISCIVLAVTVLYSHFVVERQPVIKQ